MRSEFILELVGRILRRCAYGTAFGLCNPSSAPLYVCACVYMYGGRHVQPVRCTYRREYVYACVYGMYGPSGVLVTQKCACVCLHRAWRVPSER